MASSLAAAGVAGLGYLIINAILYDGGWKGWMVIGAAMMATLGLYWLWVDFINPDPTPET